jgi:hypothetical protein
VIERIEKLCAELQRRPFVQSPNVDRLGECHVKVRQVRPTERTAAEIAVCRAIPDLGKRASTGPWRSPTMLTVSVPMSIGTGQLEPEMSGPVLS